MSCPALSRFCLVTTPVILGAIILWLSMSGTLTANDVASTEITPPETGKPAIPDSVWYDSDNGGLKPVHVVPVADDSLNRDSRWLPKAKRVKKPAKATAGAGGGTGGGGTGNFGMILLLILIVSGAVLLGYVISKTEVEVAPRSARQIDRLTPDEQTIERMKHLPAELRRTDVNLRTEAERLMNENQYDQALILLFGHQLLLLDRHTYLRLNRGKTNRKYVRETRAMSEEVAARLEATIEAFERSYFGNHAISQAGFLELWQSNVKLEQAVMQGQETAA